MSLFWINLFSWTPATCFKVPERYFHKDSPLTPRSLNIGISGMEFIFSPVLTHPSTFHVYVNSITTLLTTHAWNWGILFIVLLPLTLCVHLVAEVCDLDLSFLIFSFYSPYDFFLLVRPSVCFVCYCGSLWLSTLPLHSCWNSLNHVIYLFRTFSSSFYWQKSPDSLAWHSKPSVISLETFSAAWFLVLLNLFCTPSTLARPSAQHPSKTTDTFLSMCRCSSHFAWNAFSPFFIL